MNDLPLCVEHGHVTMYADDTSSSNCIKSVNDIVSKVVPDMQNIIDWLKANQLSLISLHRTLVEPYTRYCNTTWGRCNTSLLDTLQTLQNRAARIIANVKYENTDHAKLLKVLDWLNVRELIHFDTASLMYKIENDLALTHMKEMFFKTSYLHTYSTRSATSGGFHLPHRKLNIGKASFSYRGVHVWNQLLVEIREAQSLENFQNSLKISIKTDFRYCK